VLLQGELADFSAPFAIPRARPCLFGNQAIGRIDLECTHNRQLGELHVMGKPEKPKIEELAEELAFWNTYREVCRARKVDIARLYSEWAAELEQGLTSPGARENFTELCEAGCFPQGLAALVLLLRYVPYLEKFFTEMVGQPSYRDKAARSLENAAQTLETLYAGFIALGKDAENEQFTKLGRIAISRVVSDLRFHVKFINAAQLLKTDTETRSPAEVARYLLTGYVRRMTGRFHDECLSGLVGEIVKGTDDYNDVAQRMWRSRNYKRLEKHYSWMVKFLVAMSVVIEHTT